ncbi:hypothetical protein HYD49_00820 [Mycoplasmopsis bovis]|nr:hypothetical protein [Mycoplasmopsis bovis]QQH72707.1 hypothetical protein HYD49_00820 [Mycoplasmopsis bovis]
MRTLAKLVAITKEYFRKRTIESASTFCKKLAILNPDVEMDTWHWQL